MPHSGIQLPGNKPCYECKKETYWIRSRGCLAQHSVYRVGIRCLWEAHSYDINNARAFAYGSHQAVFRDFMLPVLEVIWNHHEDQQPF